MITTKKIRRGEKENRRKGATGFAFLLLFIVFTAACGANEGILKSGKETPAQANVQPKADSFAQELDAMRTADFRFVYVLRRKDGGVIDAEDRGVIKLQTADANRRVAANDGKAFIIGSNVQIPPKNMIVIYDRFAVENYSPQPSVEINANK